jgi:hypothetical protein
MKRVPFVIPDERSFELFGGGFDDLNQFQKKKKKKMKMKMKR